MKSSFVLLYIALLLSSLSDAADFGSPSQPPVMSPTSEPSNSNCSSVIYRMEDCLSFLLLGSADQSPTKTCCGGVKSVLEYNPECLCSALESTREMGFVVDDTKALAMPKICNIPIDPHCVSPPTTSPSSTKSPAITSSSPTATSPSTLPSQPSQSPLMSPTPGPSNSIDCSSVIYSMVDCLSFLTVGSTDQSPPITCCVGIKSVLEYSPECLCSALESSRELGFVLDDTKALAMPKICNIPIDPHCDISTLSGSTPLSPPTTSPSSTKSPVITTPSSPVVTPSPPTATSPSPLPSKSSSGILSVSKLFLAVVMVSSFLYILA